MVTRPVSLAVLALRARIAELVAAGPIAASDAYAVLRAEGWNTGQIDRARRGVVATVGVTRAAQWMALPKAKAPRPSRAKPKSEHKPRAPRKAKQRPVDRFAGGAGAGQPRTGPLWVNGQWTPADVRDPRRVEAEVRRAEVEARDAWEYGNERRTA